jgi:uncharacterized protein
MFPLGRVLFPHESLPLHVFEPRYREMIDACLTGDGEFGVVLIERGSEVGGGDSRFSVGTVAQIVEAGRLPDGRYLLATVGTRRFQVRQWLPDDPFPRAEIELRFDGDSPPDAATEITELERVLRRVSALAAELGQPVAVGVTLSDDLVRASFEAAAAAPLGPLDAQRLLELDDPVERLTSLRELLAEQAELLEHRLSGA